MLWAGGINHNNLFVLVLVIVYRDCLLYMSLRQTITLLVAKQNLEPKIERDKTTGHIMRLFIKILLLKTWLPA